MAAKVGTSADQFPLFTTEEEVSEFQSKTVLSYGLGADSTLVLVHMLRNPKSFGLKADLSDLIVITAVVGNEWKSTLNDVEVYILPLLRAAKVRYVQVARRGPYERDGWEVLSDSRSPEKVIPHGSWTLLQELQANGTVVQAAGGHACSQKFKGWVLDSWARAEFPKSTFRKIIGYSAEEIKRAQKSDSCQMANDAAAGRTICIIDYPLISSALNRSDVEAELREEFGIPWGKSYCFFCPYAGISSSREVHIARLRAHPEQAVDALAVEYVSMALNEHGSIYPGESLYARLLAAGATELLEALDQHLASTRWQLYRVRRVLPAARSAYCREAHGRSCRSPWQGCEDPLVGERTSACRRNHGPACARPQPPCTDPSRKGQAVRSLRLLDSGSRESVTARLREIAREGGELSEETYQHPLGHTRGYFLTRHGSFPTVEDFVVVAPVSAEAKELNRFANLWQSTLQLMRSN